MKRTWTSILATLLFLLFTASAFAESPKAEMHKAFGQKLKSTYADMSTRPAASGFCEVVSTYKDPAIPNKTHLDYDLNEQQRHAWTVLHEVLKMYSDLYASSIQEEDSIVNILLEECKEEVGWYNKLTPTLKPKWVDRAEYEENIRRHQRSQ